MIERIEDMPAGAIGLKAGGKLTKAEYREVLEPAIQEGIDSGELRMLFLLTDFEGIEAAALPEDIKSGLSAFGRHTA